MAVLPDVWVSFLGAAWSLSTEWQFYLLAVLVAPAAIGGVLCRGAALAWRWRGWRGGWRRRRLAVQPGVPAEQGAFLRFRRGQRGGGADRGRAVSALWDGIGGDAGALRDAGADRPAAAAAGLDFVPGGADAAGRCRVAAGGSVLRCRAARYLGGISYCVYLVNEPILKLASGVLSWVAGGDAMVFTFLWIPLAILLTLGVSSWLHRRLEVPATRWGRSLVDGPPRGKRCDGTSLRSCGATQSDGR